MLARTTSTLESGRVLRYHAVPTVGSQQLGLHAWGVAVIALYLTEGKASAALLTACVLHDAAELFTGDVPFTVKRDRPELKHAYEQLEQEAHQRLVLPMPELTKAEQAVLKLADTLEGLLWCRKTETLGSPIGGRWNEALEQGLRKFSTVLTIDVLERARSLATNPNLYPS